MDTLIRVRLKVQNNIVVVTGNLVLGHEPIGNRLLAGTILSFIYIMPHGEPTIRTLLDVSDALVNNKRVSTVHQLVAPPAEKDFESLVFHRIDKSLQHHKIVYIKDSHDGKAH